MKPGLFGQDQFAQLGGLQAVDRSVVMNLDGFLSLQQIGAVDGNMGRDLSLIHI